MWPFVCLFTHRVLRSSWELVEMCSWVPDRIGIWKCWFLTRGEDRSTWRKTSRSKGENQQLSQPTYGVNVRIRTQATLVGGGCSHFCATLAPQWHEVYWTHHRSKMLQVPFASLKTRSKLAGAGLTFAKTSWTVTRDTQKNWPLADWHIPSDKKWQMNMHVYVWATWPCKWINSSAIENQRLILWVSESVLRKSISLHMTLWFCPFFTCPHHVPVCALHVILLPAYSYDMT